MDADLAVCKITLQVNVVIVVYWIILQVEEDLAEFKIVELFVRKSYR